MINKEKLNKENLALLDGYFIVEMCTPNVFIMTEEGNFIFSDPQYRGGTNKIIRADITAKQWIEGKHVVSKGTMNIKDYCGDFEYESN